MTIMIEIKVLDHGFIRLVDKMGDDAAIVQAARVSYGTGTKTVNEDEGLIRYLMRHHHTTPFEMCEVKFHCKMPIFVARQWVRHRTANINEYSARYSVLEREFYVPEEGQIALQSATNKQGRGEPLDLYRARRAASVFDREWQRSYNVYMDLLGTDEKPGVARELARTVLPTNIYTQWYWKCDLHNIFRFLKLRMDSHAQYEIRVYAEAMAKIIQELFPIAYRAFEDYQLNARTFSGPAVMLLREMVGDLGRDTVTLPEGMSQREWQEFQKELGLL